MKRFFLVLAAVILAAQLVPTFVRAEESPSDTTCFQKIPDVPVLPTTWGGIKALYSHELSQPQGRSVHVRPLAAAASVLRIAGISDAHMDTSSAIGPTHTKILEEILGKSEVRFADVIIDCGDMTDSSQVAEWNMLGSVLGDLKPKFLTTPGNHDNRNLALYQSFYGVPPYFSRDYPEVGLRIISGNASCVETNNSAFFVWLEQQLRDIPNGWFIIYIQHHPPYSQAKRGGAQVTAQGRLVHLLEQYAVDLVICGHSHAFEVFRRSSESKPVYLVIGGAGMELSYYIGSIVTSFFYIHETSFVHHYFSAEVNADGISFSINQVPDENDSGTGQIYQMAIPRQCICRRAIQ